MLLKSGIFLNHSLKCISLFRQLEIRIRNLQVLLFRCSSEMKIKLVIFRSVLRLHSAGRQLTSGASPMDG